MQAELSVLGSMMLRPDAIGEAASALTASDFYAGRHGVVFDCMVGMFREGRPVDLVTLPAELERRGKLAEAGGVPFLAELLHIVPSPANVLHYCGIVAGAAGLRRLIEASAKIYNRAFRADLAGTDMQDWAEQQVMGLRRQSAQSSITPLETSLPAELEQLSQMVAAGQDLMGVRSGFDGLDRVIGGFHRGDVAILAGRPSMGKSTLGLDIAMNVAAAGSGPVALFSMEMTTSQLNRRLLASGRGTYDHQIDGARIRTPRLLSEQDWSRMTETVARLSHLPLWVDDSRNVTCLDIRSTCRRLKARHGLALVVVDYLQLLRVAGSTGNGNQDFTQISRDLKGLAWELDCPVLALSQLSRAVEHRTDKRPILSDLRESGSLEQEADLVAFLYRDGYYNRPHDSPVPDLDPTELIIRKQRNGPIGTVPLLFSARYQTFYGMVTGERSESEGRA
ncbi:MAG: replicative DNA helicase [Chloroflexi bacterium]|nr:replicative DNA helicase [Chloroflexota bacterium]